MENQHRHVDGYRELTPAELALMNEVKAKGRELEALFGKLSALTPRLRDNALLNGSAAYQTAEGLALEAPGAVWVDARWLAIGRTELQQGLMAWTRAIARPEGF